MPEYHLTRNPTKEKMKIIEKSIIGKKNQQECEDGIAINDNFIAVIDGSTSKTPVTINPGMRNGKYCMELIKQYVGSIPKDIDVYEFCSGITEIIRLEYIKRHIDIQRLQTNPTERLTASAIVYSAYRQQIWMIGDCQCIADNTFYDNPKPQESTLADKRAEYLQNAINDGMSIDEIQIEDPGRRYILQELIESCKEQNNTYAVIDGFDIPQNKIKKIDIKNPNTEIVLASDGYPVLRATLKDSEDELNKQLLNDPLCIHTFKATKGLIKGNQSFDDRSYIRFKG